MTCIILGYNNLKQMIRNVYCACLLLLSTGLPALAKNSGTDHAAPTFSSKAGSKVVLAPRPASSVTQANAPSHKSSEVSITRDVSRATASASLAAKQNQTASISSGSSTMIYMPGTAPVRDESGTSVASIPDHAASGGRLARVTAYWAGEGDYYTGRCMSATGVRLHDGHCAVDPNIIPYGSVVEIAGVGKFLAVDTGSAVVSRTAAREGGHTYEERHAIVVDLFFEDASAGERFAAGEAKYTSISWWTPSSMAMQAKAARSLFAEEDWGKIQSKQL
jgi:3D (Asp-Asp-Asp) domain-containing protein